MLRNNKEAEARREALVADLKKNKRSRFFTDGAIRDHIRDTLAERRRRVSNGYDFTKVMYIIIVFLVLNLKHVFSHHQQGKKRKVQFSIKFDVLVIFPAEPEPLANGNGRDLFKVWPLVKQCLQLLEAQVIVKCQYPHQ